MVKPTRLQCAMTGGTRPTLLQTVLAAIRVGVEVDAEGPPALTTIEPSLNVLTMHSSPSNSNPARSIPARSMHCSNLVRSIHPARNSTIQWR